MSFDDIVTADIRLVILLALASVSDYSHNEHVLRMALAEYKHRISRDRLRTELAWLAEQGLIKTEQISDNTLGATLTRRGKDAADGAVVVPGVKRPEPEL